MDFGDSRNLQLDEVSLRWGLVLVARCGRWNVGAWCFAGVGDTRYAQKHSGTGFDLDTNYLSMARASAVVIVVFHHSLVSASHRFSSHSHSTRLPLH